MTLPFKARWRLQQYGFSLILINRLYGDYLNKGHHYEEKDFVRFCLTNTQTHMISQRANLDLWEPSSLAVTSLAQHGIPRSYIDFSIDAFLANRNTSSHPSSLSFVRFCLHNYTVSSLNCLTQEPTFMVKGWRPTTEVQEELLNHGANQLWLDAAIAEFELYWRERNEPKPNWSRKFLWWAKTQLHKRKFAWLL